MLKVGLSVGQQAFDEVQLSEMRKSNISAIELGYAQYTSYNNCDFKKMKEYTDRCGIDVWSLHLPFFPFEEIDPASLDAEKRKFTFDIFSELIKRGTDVGIDKFVAHASTEPNIADERPEKLLVCADFFNELAEVAYKYGGTIAIEDLPRTCIGNCSDEISYLLNANDKLRVCFDSNHLLGEKNVDFIKKVGSKIITVHISDYDFLNERHWMPGEGDVDWQETYNALIESGYNGVWLYELPLKPKKTITRRDLTYTDIYNNACEIMSDKKPTPIGQRVEGLVAWNKK